MATAAHGSVDIEAVVLDWADAYYRRRICKDDKKLRELIDNEWVRMEVDWRRVLFDHHKPVFTPEPPKPGSGKLKDTCLFNTTFTNKTNSPQTYTFKAQRTSRSSCTVAMEQGVTKGVECGLKLSMPNNILEANAGFKREVTINTMTEETKEEELSWGVDSQIRVDPRHTAEAKLVIMEEEFSGKFTMETLISGIVKVNFFNLKDNNNFIKAAEGEMYRVVQDEISTKNPRLEGKRTVSVRERQVVCVSSGSCKFQYGLKQSVEVDQFKMDGGTQNGS